MLSVTVCTSCPPGSTIETRVRLAMRTRTQPASTTNPRIALPLSEVLMLSLIPDRYSRASLCALNSCTISFGCGRSTPEVWSTSTIFVVSSVRGESTRRILPDFVSTTVTSLLAPDGPVKPRLL